MKIKKKNCYRYRPIWVMFSLKSLEVLSWLMNLGDAFGFFSGKQPFKLIALYLCSIIKWGKGV